MFITADILKSFEWRVLEEFCYLIYSARNEYDVSLNNFGADGGADIIFKDKESKQNVAILQCKAYSKQLIGVNLVREFLGSMLDFGVKNGLFITTSTYSQAAKEFAVSHNITLFAAPDILDVYNQLPENDKSRIANKIFSTDYQTPTCVKCGIKMVPAVSKSGRNIWKCRKCKNTMFAGKTEAGQPTSFSHLKGTLGDRFIFAGIRKKVALQILSFILFLVLVVASLHFLPTLITSVFNISFKSPAVVSRPIPPAVSQPVNQTPIKIQTVEPEEPARYVYMLRFSNGTNEIVDDFIITGDSLNYRKGSLSVTLSKNDVQSVKRIQLK